MFSRGFSRLFLACLIVLFFGVPSEFAGGKTVIRGWLSDESCAGGRASGGLYTGTNPDCAKKCVRDGRKIVLVDPEGKRVLVIANQDAATERVGDYVEISGDLDDQAKTMHVDSVKLLEKGRAMCDAPTKKKS